MLKFVSDFNSLSSDDAHVNYRICAYTKHEFRYTKEETIRIYLEKLRDFLADVRQTIPSCKDEDWFWYDYSHKLKKVIRHSLFEDFETVYAIMLKKNEDDFGVLSLHSFSHGDDLHNDRMYGSYHHFLNKDTDSKNYLSFMFSGKWCDPDHKPHYSKQDLIELIRLIYKYYDVTHLVVDDDLFKIRFPNELDYYADSYAVFPHRKTCAWMLGLPHKISHSDIPESAEAVGIDGRNTLLISNRDSWFTSFNADHVQKANFLEIALWQNGLLLES